MQSILGVRIFTKSASFDNYCLTILRVVETRYPLVNPIQSNSNLSQDGRGAGDHRRCQNKYLALCVQRHLQVVVAFPITRRSTVGSRNTTANTATSHLVRAVNWRDTSSFIPGRKRTNAQNVTSHLADTILWSSTPSFTLGRNRASAHNVISHLFKEAIWRGTYSFTVGRNRTIAHSATFHATRLPPSKDISRGTSVKNYTCLSNYLVTCV